jgi:hypothetical protein
MSTHRHAHSHALLDDRGILRNVLLGDLVYVSTSWIELTQTKTAVTSLGDIIYGIIICIAVVFVCLFFYQNITMQYMTACTLIDI